MFIDDDSSDNTFDIIKNYLLTDNIQNKLKYKLNLKLISIIRRKKNISKYMNNALSNNIGIKYALGNILIITGGEIIQTKDTNFTLLYNPHLKNDKLIIVSRCIDELSNMSLRIFPD